LLYLLHPCSRRLSAARHSSDNAPAHAAEGHQVFLVTRRAAHAQKAMLQAPALEVILEFPLNVSGNGLPCAAIRSAKADLFPVL